MFFVIWGDERLFFIKKIYFDTVLTTVFS